MITSNSLPTTLTEAQARARYSVCVVGSYSTQSTSRFISYAEIYQGRSGMMEPPSLSTKSFGARETKEWGRDIRKPPRI